MPNFEERLSFRPLTEPPTLKALQKFQQDAGWSISRKDLEKKSDAGRRIQWVGVELDQVRIGIAKLELAPPEFCYVADLIVKSKFRGQGVGRWFLQNIEMFCMQLRIRRLALISDPESLPFYQALGFVPDPQVPGILKKELHFMQRKKLFAPPG